jgi:hypothetical protein
MATTDYEIESQRKLADFSYNLKEKYNHTHGQNRKEFLNMYDYGEITLSTVFENLFVAVANAKGRQIDKISEDGRDFTNNGDMKIGILKKDGYQRRYVIDNVANKIGTIYFVGWNWMTNKPEFHAIPKHVYGYPARGIKIPRCPYSGDVTGGKYNYYLKDSFEELALA